MKWQAKPKSLKSLTFIIKHDPLVGYYIYIYEKYKCIADYLQDSLDLAIEFAMKDFNVPRGEKLTNDKDGLPMVKFSL